MTASSFSIISALIIVFLFYKKKYKTLFFSILYSRSKHLLLESSSWETTLVFSQFPQCLDQARSTTCDYSERMRRLAGLSSCYVWITLNFDCQPLVEILAVSATRLRGDILMRLKIHKPHMVAYQFVILRIKEITSSRARCRVIEIKGAFKITSSRSYFPCYLDGG